MMKMIVNYVKDKFLLLIGVVFLQSLYLLLTDLYDLPLEPYLYGSILSTFFILVLFGFNFYKYIKRHQHFEKLMNSKHLDQTMLLADKNLSLQDNQQVIRRLMDENAQLRANFESREKEITDYYTMWVHQVKTPIAAMSLLVQSGRISEKEIKKQLFQIEQYVDMVLGYLRIDADKDLLINEADLYELSKSSIKRFAPMFISKRIKLNFNAFEAKVITDEKWLGFVIEQLISNALKYTNEGEISIDFSNESLYIQDTGIGISEEDLPRIFDQGYTGYNGRSNRKSSGIGLYLTKKIMDKLGHTISITSKVGVGTCVIIDFSRKR